MCNYFSSGGFKVEARFLFLRVGALLFEIFHGFLCLWNLLRTLRVGKRDPGRAWLRALDTLGDDERCLMMNRPV